MVDSDGAAALVLVSGEKALKLGLQVIAKITGYADAAQVFEFSLNSEVKKKEKKIPFSCFLFSPFSASPFYF